jgi:hypothetical protein
MKRSYLAAIFLVGFTNIIIAQTDTLRNSAFGMFIIAPIEFPIIDNQEINNELADLGYPKSDYSTANIGIGLQLYTNRWIASFSYNKTTKRNAQESFLSESEYRSLSVNLGYDLTKNHRYSIYPFVGFKAYGLNYLYQDKNTEGISFDGYFNSTFEYKEINYSRANLDLGLGFSYQWFFLLSFKAGYLLPLESAEWDISNGQYDLKNSPNVIYDYYFAFTIGLGNIFSDKEIGEHYEGDL